MPSTVNREDNSNNYYSALIKSIFINFVVISPLTTVFWYGAHSLVDVCIIAWADSNVITASALFAVGAGAQVHAQTNIIFFIDFYLYV